MNKKFLILLMTITILMLGGCRLAVEDDGTAQSQDVLCGVFVTLEPLEPIPAETTIELPANWNGNIEDVLFNEENSRIYATRHEEENGFVDYTFDGIFGIRMFSITERHANDEENYSATIRDDLWQDGSSHYTVTDSGNDIQLTGTLCFDVHYPCRIYLNPVYQTTDGRVYVTYGNSHFFDSPDKQPGDWGSTTISETATQTLNGEKTSHSLEATVKLAGINTNRQVVLKQMDNNDNVIEQTAITQDNIPESIRMLPDTAYMMMEEHSVATNGETVVTRALVKTDEELLGVRFTGDYGIISSYPVTLVH